jgi:hypothetical protein
MATIKFKTNSSYEVQQVGSGYQVRIENCYWGGGAPPAGETSGNVDYSPYITAVPNPIGWGFGDTYDPTFLIVKQPPIIAALHPP